MIAVGQTPTTRASFSPSDCQHPGAGFNSGTRTTKKFCPLSKEGPRSARYVVRTGIGPSAISGSTERQRWE